MASVISAALTKFDALTGSNFPSSTVPDIYLDEAPAVDGSQKRPPYAVLTDDGTTPDYAQGYSLIETTRFKVTLYYNSLADCDAAALAVKYNGGAHDDGSGFDFGALTLPAGYTFLCLKRTSERRFLAGYDRAAARVHAVELTYEAEARA